MELTAVFPCEHALIARQAARFRALSPADKVRVICGIHEVGMMYLQQSPILREYFDEQERINKQAIKEFLARSVASQGRVGNQCSDSQSQ